MTDRIRARVAVTALLILLAAAGIRAIGPAGDWARPGGHAVAIGLLLEAVLAGLFGALRWRYRPPPAALAGKLNRIVSAALVVSMLGVLLGIALDLFSNSSGQERQRPVRIGLTPKVVRSFAKTRRIPPAHWPLLLTVVIAILIIIAIIVVLIIAWRRGRTPDLRVGPDLGVDEADDLARAVESGRLALLDIDDARAAIIACYVAMERSLAKAGTARGDAETPDELLVRTVSAGLVPPEPARLLTGLFYEARYSTHQMPSGARDQAASALTAIAAELPVIIPA